MDQPLVTEAQMFWPVVLAAGLTGALLVSLLTALWIAETVREIEQYVQNYLEVGVPQWGRRRSH